LRTIGLYILANTFIILLYLGFCLTAEIFSSALLLIYALISGDSLAAMPPTDPLAAIPAGLAVMAAANALIFARLARKRFFPSPSY
jgi:hypothetical protein